ncbi:hypothetical protein LCGC14_1790150 [marine sediment metagenome]|uniref:Uncharacterized protein n=1 Tax=marine sediment metagenome TaxID=412755 RepID=A0A0F9HFD2_9ZZZZ
MREQIIVRTVTKKSETYGEYEIVFVKPAAAIVTLCTFTSNPDITMYLTTRAYKGIYEPDPALGLADGEKYYVEDALEDVQKTKLQTPLEMVHMLWSLQDVTRAFTHQIVRYRVGTAFVQESMRFFGMHKTFKVLVTHEAASDTAGPRNTILDQYCYGAVAAIDSYVDLLGRGVPDQDARGVLPTNILTNIYFDCSLRTLQNIFPQRLCCQAQQGEWQPILREMRKQIGEQMGDSVEALLRAPYERGEDCGYRASFDRPCTWQKEQIA